MKQKIVLTGILLAAALFTAGCSHMPGMGVKNMAGTHEQDVYELKISTSQTEQSLITKNYQKLADELNTRSNGRLKVDVLPAGQLVQHCINN